MLTDVNLDDTDTVVDLMNTLLVCINENTTCYLRLKTILLPCQYLDSKSLL